MHASEGNSVHYRLPLRLISSGDWARITPAARAVLAVIGVFANRSGKAWPGLERICSLSGYRKHETVQGGIKSLQESGLVVKKKMGRHNVYLLTKTAKPEGHSYFPIYKKVVEKGHWANLLPCEKSVFGVLAVKATVNHPEVDCYLDGQGYALGALYHTAHRKLSGVSKTGFNNALQGLIDKRWIYLTEYNEYVVWASPCHLDD